jgi:hypothetical protein
MAVATLALAGCVAYAPYPGYAYPGYGYPGYGYPGYAPAPVYGSVDIGLGFGDGWRHDGWHREGWHHWR